MSGEYTRPSPVNICASRSFIEGLLWPILQPIRSQWNRECHPVWYNLMHTHREWRMHSPVFRPPFSDCPNSPPTPVSCRTVTLWHASSSSVIGHTTKEDLLSLQGSLKGVGALPGSIEHTKSEPKMHRCRHDEMKRFTWFVCKNISGTLLFMLYCKLFSLSTDINNGPVL